MQTIPKLAETLNGALVIDIFFALTMFAIFIIVEVKHYGFRMRAQAAVAIATILLGDTILRTWFLVWRRLLNRGTPIAWDGWNVAMCGIGIEMIGVLLVIRVFAPDTWGRYAWVKLGASALVLSFLFAFLI